MSEDNKAQYKRVWEQINNEGKLEVIDEAMTSDYVFHDPHSPCDSPEALKEFVRVMQNAFSDIRFEVIDMIGEGDKAAKRWVIRARHTGEFQGIAATGKEIQFGGISIARFENGKLAEEWEAMDTLGMMQQLRGSS